MKKIHILGLLVIAAAIAVLMSAAGDMAEYSSFADAAEADGGKVKIVGQLAKDKPLEYNPEVDANMFTFYMRDNKGVEKKVILRDKKPQDFERSEQIVATGSIINGEFVASELLLKCPSKYKDEEVRIKAQS
jgi:cytochrome c-type biogenesis protein CcmE